jgi:hypothetical protein
MTELSKIGNARLPLTLMLSWLVPLKSNFIVEPSSTLKLPVTLMVLIEPTAGSGSDIKAPAIASATLAGRNPAATGLQTCFRLEPVGEDLWGRRWDAAVVMEVD